MNPLHEDITLFEIINRDVGPHITIEIEDDLVGSYQRMKNFSKIVMRFYLSGHWVVYQSQ